MAQDGRAPCAERYAGLGVRRTLHRFPRLPHPAARALPHAAAAGVVPADVCGVPARSVSLCLWSHMCVERNQ